MLGSLSSGSKVEVPGEDEEGPGENTEAGPGEQGVHWAERQADLVLSLEDIICFNLVQCFNSF